MNTWDIQKKPLVIGLQLDDSHAAFLKSAVSLARRLGSCLEVVHCFEEATAFMREGHETPGIGPNPPHGSIPASEVKALRFLKDLAEKSMHAVDIHIHIERGQPAEDLSRIASEVGAGMIVCGIRDHAKGRTLKGLSTALSLAFYAPVPVLILPLESQLDFEKPINVLLCDTLGGSGWQVLASGLQFADKLDVKSMFHAHILKTPEAALATGGLQNSLIERIKEELLYRFYATPSAATWTDRYHMLAAVGDLDTRILGMIDENTCSLVIIGREQFLSGRHIALDRIPYQALLERKIGLLVLPDAQPSQRVASHPAMSYAAELESGTVLH